jgi:ABC-2 type transport system permease protein
MTIFKFALLRGIRSKDYLVNAVLPLVLIFVLPLWTASLTESRIDNPQGFYLMGLAILWASSSTAKAIMLDKSDGTIIRILTTPTSMLRYLTQNFFASMIPLTIQTLSITTIGKFTYNWQISFAFYLFLCYTVFAMSSVALLFAWSCLFKNKETSNMMFGFVVMFAAMLGGFILPLELLPKTVQLIGAVFPAYWLSMSISELLSGGTTIKYWLSLGAIILFAVAYLLYGGKRRII